MWFADEMIKLTSIHSATTRQYHCLMSSTEPTKQVSDLGNSGFWQGSKSSYDLSDAPSAVSDVGKV
jgi:hypothetical protein